MKPQSAQNQARLRQEQAERRAKVAAMRQAGVLDQRLIAKQLGISEATVSRDIKWLMEEWRKQAMQDTGKLRGLQLQRIERLLSALWIAATEGKLGAVDRVVKLLDRQAQLLGLDAPKTVKIDMEARIREVAEELGFTAEEIVAEAEALLRENSPS